MSRVLSIPFGSRRTIALLVAIGAAILLALGVMLEPPSSDEGGPTASAGSSQAVAEPASADPSAAGPIGAAAITDPAATEAIAPDADGRTATPYVAKADAATSAGGAAATDEVSSDGAAIAPSGGLDAPGLDQKIIRTASIELKVKRGHFEDVWGDAQSVAGTAGGYIASASRSGAGKDTRVGTITMRVPTGKFDAAVERLRGIGATKVERLDISSDDVTQEYVDTKSRLRHDRAVEGRLLALLSRTDEVGEVLAVSARLDQVQEQIEVEKGRLQYLDKLTALSTISVTLRAPASARDSADDHGSVLGDAWSDARERFAENVAAAIVWIGGALPTLLVLAALAITGRIVWRRRAARNEAVNTPE